MAARALPKALQSYPVSDVPCSTQVINAYEEAVAREKFLDEEERARYASKVGMAMFAGPSSRFYVLYALGMCARCITFPSRAMDTIINRVIAYLGFGIHSRPRNRL